MELVEAVLQPGMPGSRNLGCQLPHQNLGC